MRTSFVIIYSALILSITHAKGQSMSVSQAKIRWTTSSFSDLVSSTNVFKTSVFVTDAPGKRVEWVQKNGTLTYNIAIIDATDNWQDFTGDGKVTFLIQWEGKNGTLIVSREQGQLKLMLDVNPSGKDRLYFIFDIASFEII